MPEITNRRIAQNTFILFLRMFIVMSINLFTVRIVLQALGIEDYGIYNVVSGFVAMFSCISSVLATATQRFFSYNLGISNFENLKTIFTASFFIYLAFSGLVFIVGETLGLWFINSQLVIPETRMVAANFIYQFSIISFIVSVLIVPFSAAVVAHEQFNFYAIVSLADCILRFLLVLALEILIVDRLIVYGFFLMLVQVAIFALYYLFCKRKYKECHFVRIKNKTMYKELISFSGWTLFGSVAGMGMMQVNTILINIFFGPILNASRAISLQIHTAILQLSNNFIMAVRPPMIKSFADCNYSELSYLFLLSNKMILFLMSVCCIPLYSEMPFILKVWLGDCSHETIVFSRLIVIYTFFLSFHNPITIIIQAMGIVKEYFVPVEMITLLCAPITYILFRVGFSAEYTFWTMIVCIIGSHIIRLIILKKYYFNFSLRHYLKSVVLFSFMTVSLTVWTIHIIIKTINNSWLELFAVIIVTIFIVGGIILLIGMNRQERNSIIKLFKRVRS